jgi:hypothetical protein
MKLITKAPLLIKSILLSLLVLSIKCLFFGIADATTLQWICIPNINNISVVLTGVFFVMGFIFAGNISDFKEAERSPGEIASHLEAIENWINHGFRTLKNANNLISEQHKIELQLLEFSQKIKNWLESPKKESQAIFPAFHFIDDITMLLYTNNADKESIKGTIENSNQLRRVLNRTYSISRTQFLLPAYTLQKSIIIISGILFILVNDANWSITFLLTTSLSFILNYLYFLSAELDDPFASQDDDSYINLLPLNRFIDRLKSHTEKVS